MPIWLLWLKGKTLGQTVYNVLALVAVLVVVGWFAFVTISGRFWEWRFDRADARADKAEAGLVVAEKIAVDADGSASNASFTRGRVDFVLTDNRVKTEEAATRAEKYEGSAAATGALPDDLVRELEDATDRAATAARGLQRKGAR